MSCDNSTQRNQAESLLLKAPAEVRSLIYEYAIGGHHFFITGGVENQRTDPTPPARTRCTYVCSTDTESPNSARLAQGFGTFTWKQYTFPSEVVWSDKDPKITMLWKVCRQLHQETSLMLYSTNIFSFSGCTMMQVFLSELKPVQIHALTKVCLPNWYLHFKKYEKLFVGVKEFLFWNAKMNAAISLDRKAYMEYAAKFRNGRGYFDSPLNLYLEGSELSLVGVGTDPMYLRAVPSGLAANSIN